MTDENMGMTDENQAGEKTFTQSELDSILKERLSRERAKYADYETLKEKATAYDAAEEAQKTELQKAIERAEKAEKAVNAYQAEAARNAAVNAIAAATGVDAAILGMMRGDTETEIQANADALKKRFDALPKYPNVHDNGSSGGGSTLTRADIMGIKDDKERLKAIKENINLWEKE